MFPGEIVCYDYEIIKKIGYGSFGFVYKVRHRSTHYLYALKTDEKSVTKSYLQNEVHILKILEERYKNSHTYKDSSSRPFSFCLDHFFSYYSSNKMIMPLFGENLFNIFQRCNKRFDSNTIYEVAKVMLKNIEEIHSLGFIHRDIKPQNFVIGEVFEYTNRNDDGIYLLDFGLAKTYQNYDNSSMISNHVPYEIGRKIRGTPMYMSINVMLGIEPSRRDDLYALMYIVVLFMKGRLPWHGLRITKKDFDDLLISKISIHPDELFSGMPIKLKETFIYIRKLKFYENPDYKKILDSFESILTYKNYKIEEEYNGKYRKYCWYLVFQKYSFQNDFDNGTKKLLENFLTYKEYTLLN